MNTVAIFKAISQVCTKFGARSIEKSGVVHLGFWCSRLLKSAICFSYYGEPGGSATNSIAYDISTAPSTPSTHACHSYSVQLIIYLICPKSCSLGDLLIRIHVFMLPLIRLAGTDIYNIKYSSHYTLVVMIKSFSFSVKWLPYFRVAPPPHHESVCR